jgi:hypothetical protein
MPPKMEVFGFPKLQLLWDDEGKRAKIIALSGGPLRKGAPAMTSEQMKAVLGDQAALIKEVVVNRIIMRLQTERHPTLTEMVGEAGPLGPRDWLEKQQSDFRRAAMQEAMAHFTTLGEEEPPQPQPQPQQQQTVVALTAAEQEVQAHVSMMKHWQDMAKGFWGANFKHLPLVAHRLLRTTLNKPGDKMSNILPPSLSWDEPEMLLVDNIVEVEIARMPWAGCMLVDAVGRLLRKNNMLNSVHKMCKDIANAMPAEGENFIDLTKISFGNEYEEESLLFLFDIWAIALFAEVLNKAPNTAIANVCRYLVDTMDRRYMVGYVWAECEDAKVKSIFGAVGPTLVNKETQRAERIRLGSEAMDGTGLQLQFGTLAVSHGAFFKNDAQTRHFDDGLLTRKLRNQGGSLPNAESRLGASAMRASFAQNRAQEDAEKTERESIMETKLNSEVFGFGSAQQRGSSVSAASRGSSSVYQPHAYHQWGPSASSSSAMRGSSSEFHARAAPQQQQQQFSQMRRSVTPAPRMPQSAGRGTSQSTPGAAAGAPARRQRQEDQPGPLTSLQRLMTRNGYVERRRAGESGQRSSKCHWCNAEHPGTWRRCPSLKDDNGNIIDVQAVDDAFRSLSQ